MYVVLRALSIIQRLFLQFLKYCYKKKQLTAESQHMCMFFCVVRPNAPPAPPTKPPRETCAGNDTAIYTHLMLIRTWKVVKGTITFTTLPLGIILEAVGYPTKLCTDAIYLCVNVAFIRYSYISKKFKYSNNYICVIIDRIRFRNHSQQALYTNFFRQRNDVTCDPRALNIRPCRRCNFEDR